MARIGISCMGFGEMVSLWWVATGYGIVIKISGIIVLQLSCQMVTVNSAPRLRNSDKITKNTITKKSTRAGLNRLLSNGYIFTIPNLCLAKDIRTPSPSPAANTSKGGDPFSERSLTQQGFEPGVITKH